MQEGDDFAPHKFVGDAYRQYLRRYPNNPSVNGRIFEYLVCETLAREGVVPFYCQVQFAFVPNANFDVVLFHPRRPVVLSMKVSLRERYKQADLEGNALRQVYRNAECYLITLSHGEVDSVNRKIESGDIGGVRACIIADSPEYSALIRELKLREFHHATPITPITGTVYPVSSM